MEKEFVPYELAVKLKELGFDEPCFGYYITLNGKDWKLVDTYEYHQIDDELNIGPKFILSAPTFSQAFRWFDENTSFQGFIVPSIKEDHFDWEILNLDTEEKIECTEYYSTRKEAELACLNKLIEIVEGIES